MKNIRVLLFAILIVFFTSALAGCGSNEETYTLNFETNGGDTIESISTDGSSQISIPNDPTKDGFSFDGWYWDNDIWANPVTINSLVDAPISTDMTIYAKWNIDNTVTIIFESNNGEATTSHTTDDVSTILLPTDPVKAGFDFDGWYWDNNVWEDQLVMGDSYMDAPTPNDFTVYAKWIENNNVTIIFESNNGEATTSHTTDKVSTILLPTDPVKAGFDFDGWYWDDNVWEDQLVMGDSYMDAPTPNNFTVYAKWIEITVYTIIFNTNGGNPIESILTDGRSSYLFPNNPTKEGFEFDGWYKDNNVWEQRLLAETIFDDVSASNEVHLYAKWIEINYTITLDVNGGFELEETTLEMSIGQDYTLPTPNNYESVFFTGWFTALVDGTLIELTGQWTIQEDTTLYAQWSPYLRVDDYIYFGFYPQTIKTSSVTITTSTPDLDGYYLGSDGARYAKVISTPHGEDYSFSDDSSIVEGNTYYFKVEPLKWRILTEDNGLAMIFCTMGIDHLSYSNTGNSYEESPIRAWLNNEFYANAFTDYHRAFIETTLIDNSASTTSDPNSIYASADTFDNVSLMSYQDMLNTDYGFSDNPGFEDPNRRIVITDYSRSTGGVIRVSPREYYNGKGYLWLRSPRDKYTAQFIEYNGWIGHSSYTYDSYSVAPVLRIQLADISTYTLSFETLDGSPVDSITTNNHSQINAPMAPTKENFTFGGWYYDNETFENVVEFPYTINEDMTIYAHWTSIYTLSFDTNGATAIDSTSQSSLIEIFAPTEPIKEGYTFRGWFYEETYENAVIFPITLDQDKTIYSKWTEVDTAAYARIDYSGIENTNGDYILFGDYPQTLMEDSVLITSQTPNSEGYYLGSDGERYAKVIATPYSDLYNYTYNFSDDSEILEGTTYYFRVEPIKWRILEQSDGSALILSEMLIDSHRFADDSNNYADSEIRAWLNNEFYNKAFNEYQIAVIETTLVDNSLNTVAYPDDNVYTCEDTNDNIFLLSYADMKRAAYGFNSEESIYDPSRRRLTTDYTRSMGTYFYAKDSLYYGSGNWFLRTPSYLSPSIVRAILYHGSDQHYQNVDNANDGIVPALTIILD